MPAIVLEGVNVSSNDNDNLLTIKIFLINLGGGKGGYLVTSQHFSFNQIGEEAAALLLVSKEIDLAFLGYSTTGTKYIYSLENHLWWCFQKGIPDYFPPT